MSLLSVTSLECTEICDVNKTGVPRLQQGVDCFNTLPLHDDRQTAVLTHHKNRYIIHVFS